MCCYCRYFRSKKGRLGYGDSQDGSSSNNSTFTFDVLVGEKVADTRENAP